MTEDEMTDFARGILRWGYRVLNGMVIEYLPV